MPEPGTTRPEARPHRAGTLVLVVGPSGTGKDTLIAYARETLREHSDAVFPRRFITHRADPALEKCARLGRGVPPDAGRRSFRTELGGTRPALRRGGRDRCGHRIRLHGRRERLARHRADRPHPLRRRPLHPPAPVLAERLGSRGRENAEDVQKRLARVAEAKIERDTVLIVNDASAEKAGELLVRAVLRLQEA